jgi:hypothetical protein
VKYDAINSGDCVDHCVLAFDSIGSKDETVLPPSSGQKMVLLKKQMKWLRLKWNSLAHEIAKSELQARY